MHKFNSIKINGDWGLGIALHLGHVTFSQVFPPVNTVLQFQHIIFL